MIVILRGRLYKCFEGSRLLCVCNTCAKCLTQGRVWMWGVFYLLFVCCTTIVWKIPLAPSPCDSSHFTHDLIFAFPLGNKHQMLAMGQVYSFYIHNLKSPFALLRGVCGNQKLEHHFGHIKRFYSALWWFSCASQLSTLIATASEMDLKFADWEQSLF